MFLLDLRVVVAAREGFGDPFLLEKGFVVRRGCGEAGEVVEVVFRPGLPDFLEVWLVNCLPLEL